MTKKYYMAPLEGITTYLYRQVYQEVFGGVEKYYTPFLVPHTKKDFDAREKKEILPEHNEGMQVVPQILTNQPEDFVRLAKCLKEFGYDEVNLNVGCPSGTVTAKGRGAGFLAYPDRIDSFLKIVFEELQDMKVSVKTRLGVEDTEEFEELLDIYNRYPIYELTIHARVLKDFYRNQVKLDTFDYACQHSKNPLVYNGDVFDKASAVQIEEKLPDIQAIMLGRGLIANPFLPDILAGKQEMNREKIREFHDKLYEGYKQTQSGDKNVMFRMKELWVYMGCLFTEFDQYSKRIFKCNKCYEYDTVINSLFREQDISEDAHFISG